MRPTKNASTDTLQMYSDFAQVDVARDQLLDDDENLLRGKGDHVAQAERRLKHKLRPLNAWRLIPFFELFISCPKDELHQWYLGLSVTTLCRLSSTGKHKFSGDLI
jgi:hypothetical protein